MSALATNGNRKRCYQKNNRNLTVILQRSDTTEEVSENPFYVTGNCQRSLQGNERGSSDSKGGSQGRASPYRRTFGAYRRFLA